jgi:hypothetical protein
VSQYANRFEDTGPIPFTARVRILAIFILFTFLFHFSWEILQTPLFARMPVMSHWQATLVCLRATIGDIGIALAAFGASALLDRNVAWFLRPSAGALVGYMAVGVLFTTVFEWHAVYWANRWAYSNLMPVVPLLGIGASPLLQWLVIPPVALHLLRRHFREGGRP